VSSKNPKKTPIAPSLPRSTKPTPSTTGGASRTRSAAVQGLAQPPVTIEIAEPLSAAPRTDTPAGPVHKKPGALAPRPARAPKAKTAATPAALASTSAGATADAAAAPLATPRAVTDEDIRIHAYFLSLEHRTRGGSDIDFWLIAERELREAGQKA